MEAVCSFTTIIMIIIIILLLSSNSFFFLNYRRVYFNFYMEYNTQPFLKSSRFRASMHIRMVMLIIYK